MMKRDQNAEEGWCRSFRVLILSALIRFYPVRDTDLDPVGNAARG